MLIHTWHTAVWHTCVCGDILPNIRLVLQPPFAIFSWLKQSKCHLPAKTAHFFAPAPKRKKARLDTNPTRPLSACCQTPTPQPPRPARRCGSTQLPLPPPSPDQRSDKRWLGYNSREKLRANLATPFPISFQLFMAASSLALHLLHEPAQTLLEPLQLLPIAVRLERMPSAPRGDVSAQYSHPAAALP